MLKLIRGDDATCVLDTNLPEATFPTGTQIELEIGSFVRRFAIGGEITINFPAAWTGWQPCGRLLGTWRLVGADGRKVTITKTFPIYLTDDAGSGNFKGSLGGGASVQRVDFSDIVELSAGASPGDVKSTLNEMLRRLKKMCILLTAILTVSAAAAALSEVTILDEIAGTNTIGEIVRAGGAITTADVDTVKSLIGARQKYDLSVYRSPDEAPYKLVDDACPVLVRYMDGSTSPHKGIVFYESDVSQDDAPSYDPDYIYLYAKTYDPETDWWIVDFRVAFRRSDGVANEINYDGGFENDDITFGGKPFKKGEWPKIEKAPDVIDQLATTSQVAAVRSEMITHSLVSNIAQRATGGFVRSGVVAEMRDKGDTATYEEQIHRPYRLHDDCFYSGYVDTDAGRFSLDRSMFHYVDLGTTLLAFATNIGYYGEITVVAAFDLSKGNCCTNVSCTSSRNAAAKSFKAYIGGRPFAYGQWPKLSSSFWPTGDRFARATEIQPSSTSRVVEVHYIASREYNRDIAVNGVTLANGEIYAGVAFSETNLVNVVPVLGTTACVRIYAPYAQGAYHGNRYSAIEIGDFYQMLFAHRAQIGSALYLPGIRSINFISKPGQFSETMEEYLYSTFVPQKGGCRMEGPLVVNGAFTVNGVYNIENADIRAKGFSVVDRVLTSDSGMVVSGGVCRVNHVTSANGVEARTLHVSSLDAMTYEKGDGSRISVAARLAQLQSDAVAESLLSIEVPAERLSAMPLKTKVDNPHMTTATKMWTLKNRHINVLTDSNFPYSEDSFFGQQAGKAIFFPWLPEDYSEKENPQTISIGVYVDYKENVPVFMWGYYTPAEGAWKLASDDPDVFSIKPGVPVFLFFQQISPDTLMVTRRELTTQLN